MTGATLIVKLYNLAEKDVRHRLVGLGADTQEIEEVFDTVYKLDAVGLMSIFCILEDGMCQISFGKHASSDLTPLHPRAIRVTWYAVTLTRPPVEYL